MTLASPPRWYGTPLEHLCMPWNRWPVSACSMFAVRIVLRKVDISIATPHQMVNVFIIGQRFHGYQKSLSPGVLLMHDASRCESRLLFPIWPPPTKKLQSIHALGLFRSRQVDTWQPYCTLLCQLKKDFFCKQPPVCNQWTRRCLSQLGQYPYLLIINRLFIHNIWFFSCIFLLSKSSRIWFS